MSATVAMPCITESAFKEMCANAMLQAANKLAEKYGFDAEEARRFLNVDELQVIITKKESKKAKKAKKAKSESEDKPKRKPTGYLMYTTAQRPVAKLALEAALAEGEKLKPQNVIVELAKMWRELSEQEQEVWKATAKGDSSSDSD